MNMAFGGRFTWTAVLILVAGTSACSRCSDELGTQGAPGAGSLGVEAEPPLRQVTIGIQQQPDTLWAPFHEMMAAMEVLGAGQITLTTFDEQWRIQPFGATSVPTLANGGLELIEDGTKMRATWHIDDELIWPDGTPVTADDFVFAHKIVTDPRYEVVDRTFTEKVASMRAEGEDRRTLVVEWKQPYAFYANPRAHTVLPKHLVEKLYLDHPDSLASDPFGVKPMLPGSFSVAEWVRGSHIIVERNPAARGRWKPWLDRIIFRIIPSTAALEANLVSGTIDAVSSGWLPLDRVEALEEKHKDTFNFYFVEGLIFEHIDCNLDNPILADVRVRRALLYGLDRAGMVQALFGQRQPVADSWVPPRRSDHNAEVRRYQYDQATASRLLEEAGWTMGPDGVRMKDGLPLRLSIMTTSGHATRERIEQMLQRDWRKIGVELEIRNQPAKIFFRETLRRRAFPALAMYAWTMDPMYDSSSLWRCDQIPSAGNGWRGQNYPGWCNQEVTAIHQQIERTLDEDERAAQLRRQQALWAEALPVLPLYFRIEPSVTVKRLKGWTPTGTLVPVTWNAASWQLVE